MPRWAPRGVCVWGGICPSCAPKMRALLGPALRPRAPGLVRPPSTQRMPPQGPRPPVSTHLRPRPRPRTFRSTHLPCLPSRPPCATTKVQPRSSSAARVSKGVRLRHHSQMAEPPWPAAQAAHWTLPPAATTTIGWHAEPRHSIGSCCRRSTQEPQVPPLRRSG